MQKSKRILNRKTNSTNENSVTGENMSQELLDLLLKAVEIVKADIQKNDVTPTEVNIVVKTPIVVPAVVEAVIAPAEVKTPIVEATAVPETEQDAPDFNALLNLLNGNEWPEAVSSVLICNDSEEDKLERADGIIDFINDSFGDKSVLDFGCGEGHISLKLGDLAHKSVGYDIVQSGVLSWESDGDYLLTTDFEKVKANGPYDIVLVYDVLDHCKDPVEALKQIASVCKPTTKIIVRCHSWMSRHGAHLYKQKNKAWVHLFFTEKELNKMGLTIDPIQKCFFPIDTQNNWFKNAGFKIIKSNPIKTFVEPFFRRPLLVARLPVEHKNKFPEWQMSQLFNDYTLNIQ
jgi:2-polyprenyl-3-methyl-5-hydroxy-6-metoxy-1,4-benzoquinol methylase